jgi:hypothetical protein
MKRRPPKPAALALAAAAALVLSSLGRAEATPADRAASPPDVIRAPQTAVGFEDKVAVVLSAQDHVGDAFTVVDAAGQVAYTGTLVEAPGSPSPWQHAALAVTDYPTQFGGHGTYTIHTGDLVSNEMVVDGSAYADLLTTLLGLYDANRDGREASSYHGPSHLNDARSAIRNGPHRGERIDVTGGWMDAGDQLKFTTTIAYATTALLVAARVDVPRQDELSAVAQTGVRWLRKAHPSKGVFVAQVGNTHADHDLVPMVRDPADDDDSDVAQVAQRPTYVLTDKTGGADVAAMASTALALAAQERTGTARSRLVALAEQWLAKAQQLRRVWTNCCYQQDSWRDDAATAEAELWRATGDEAWADAALRDLEKVTLGGEDPARIGVNGYDMAALAAGELCGKLQASPASGSTRTRACALLTEGGAYRLQAGRDNAFGRANGGTYWGSLRDTADGGIVGWLGGSQLTAVRAVEWLVGVNPWGVRFQAGLGVNQPYHWAQLLGDALPSGAVPGGPATVAEVTDEGGLPVGQLGPYDTEDLYYVDDPGNYVTNEVSLGYQSAYLLLVAMLSGDQLT